MKLNSTLQRRRHLENDHFLQVDRDLRTQLVDHLERDRRIESLRSATRVRDEDVLEELAAAGFDADSLPVLALYPVVLVAWSDGFVGAEERRRILDAALSFGCVPGTPSHERLRKWLTQGPSVRLRDTWKKYTRAVCALCDDGTRQAMKNACLVQARFVATASGGALGIDPISDSEANVLEDLASTFEGVD